MTLRKFAALTTLLGALVLSTGASADILVQKAWVRATVGAGKVSAGYATITNTDATADELVSVSTPAAMMTELHETKDDNGIMKMEPVDTFIVPANGAVDLKPGSFHLMIMNVMQPMNVGETVDLTFTFKRKGAVTVKAKVMPLSATSAD